MKFTITRIYNWSMGHALWYHEGKCWHPHGHNYRMEVEVSGPVDPREWSEGMVMDFEDLDAIVDPIVSQYDHEFLMNEEDERHHGGNLHFDFSYKEFPFEPTAELLALQMLKDIGDELPEGRTLERVTIYETERASATVRRT